MTPERRQRIERLYHETLARDAGERGPYLASACGGDEALRREVESLLAQPMSADQMLEAGAAAVAVGLVVGAPVAFATGTRFGVYELQGLLGKGGMGEVYRARDTRLQRDVAVKLLPAALTEDPDRLTRFEREARLLAAVNHPNVAAIFGVEEVAGPSGFHIGALIMELIPGETLAECLTRRGSLPLAEVLPLAGQIADALDAAHEKGIVHRDLKPANIKVTPDGIAKVLDFGLAKAALPDGPGTDLTVSATREGTIVGTAAYMSPEQARGQPADKRTDIWAFGCVLFEMLAGRPVFARPTLSETLAAILEREPDWDALPKGLPASVRHILSRCLDKNAKRRARDIGDVRSELDHAMAAPGEVPVRRLDWRERAKWVAAFAAAIVVAAALIARGLLEAPAAPQAETRVDVVTPATSDPFSIAMAPDGRRIVFAGSDGPAQRLWVRSLDEERARVLSGTEGASFPFWAPDSASIGFFADGQLKVIAVQGDTPRRITDAAPRGGTWSREDEILFAREATGPLFRIRASGGEPEAVTQLQGQLSHRFPHFLPDGRQFLFYAQGTSATSGIHLGSLDRSPPKRLTPSSAAAVYRRGDWLVFGRSGALLAQRLDLADGRLTGDPITVAESVALDVYRGAISLSVSADGLLAYRTGAASSHQLTWVDRSGTVLGVEGPPSTDGIVAPRLSPDGRRIAVYRTIQENTDVWILEADHWTRLTFHPEIDRMPRWSPDGTQIVFESNRTGARNLYLKRSDLSAEDERLLTSPDTNVAEDWSPDGRFVLFTDSPDNRFPDIWMLPMEGARTPRVFLKTGADERFPSFSPDGAWVAYTSNASGRYEIYVRPFNPPGSERQVSTSGGIHPRWSPGGNEIYYVAPDGTLMAAPVVRQDRGQLSPGSPVVLFQGRMFGGADLNVGRNYDVSRDGRFLLNRVVDAETPITLLQNWSPSR